MDKKKNAVIINTMLLIWYFLSMTGLKIGSKYLVESAFKDELIFMIIPAVTLLLFVFFKKVGKYVHLIWLVMWFATQILSHEWYTIFGRGFMGDVEGKINYFHNCIQLVNCQGRYVPDLYHIILHILILLSMISIIIVPNKSEKSTTF